MQDALDKLILALDFPSAAPCFPFLEQLWRTGQPPRWVKVGLQLFLSEGPPLVVRLREAGYQVFLDLKLHDIPNTVAGAVRAVLPLQPALLTVHASGGSAMLRAAQEAAAGSDTRLLAVTVLTSMNAAALAETGVPDAPETQVEHLARLTRTAGLAGVVCSPLEAVRLRELGLYLVTPGIRPAGASEGDQQRTATPTQALQAGVSQLVIGRPVTAAADPARAWLDVVHEVNVFPTEKPGLYAGLVP